MQRPGSHPSRSRPEAYSCDHFYLQVGKSEWAVKLNASPTEIPMLWLHRGRQKESIAFIIRWQCARRMRVLRWREREGRHTSEGDRGLFNYSESPAVVCNVDEHLQSFDGGPFHHYIKGVFWLREHALRRHEHLAGYVKACNTHLDIRVGVALTRWRKGRGDVGTKRLK